MPVNIVLAIPESELADAFERYFADLPYCSVHRGFFETVPKFDAMVSAANSFGLMDGGVDLAITRFFGEQLMQRVQQHIIQDYLGEQSVGTAFVIYTHNALHPWLIHAPTMRTPEITNGTDATYRATWASLLAIHHHNANCVDEKIIECVVFPGMGTGCGQVIPDSAASQMALAWRHYLNPLRGIDWPAVLHRTHDVKKSVFSLG